MPKRLPLPITTDAVNFSGNVNGEIYIVLQLGLVMLILLIRIGEV